jgi:hypothetical protein
MSVHLDLRWTEKGERLESIKKTLNTALSTLTNEP